MMGLLILNAVHRQMFRRVAGVSTLHALQTLHVAPLVSYLWKVSHIRPVLSFEIVQLYHVLSLNSFVVICTDCFS